MVRRVSMLALAVALMTAVAGCRLCGPRGLCSSSRGETPCQLMGQSGSTCLDGIPTSGGAGVPIIPAPGSIPPPGLIPADSLPYPQPNDLIPRPGVPIPSAVPVPAPGEGASVLPVPKMGVPVKGSK